MRGQDLIFRLTCQALRFHRKPKEACQTEHATRWRVIHERTDSYEHHRQEAF